MPVSTHPLRTMAQLYKAFLLWDPIRKSIDRTYSGLFRTSRQCWAAPLSAVKLRDPRCWDKGIKAGLIVLLASLLGSQRIAVSKALSGADSCPHLLVPAHLTTNCLSEPNSVNKLHG